MSGLIFSLQPVAVGSGDPQGHSGLIGVGGREPCRAGRVRIGWRCDRKLREGERACACTGAWLIARSPIAESTEARPNDKTRRKAAGTWSCGCPGGGEQSSAFLRWLYWLGYLTCVFAILTKWFSLTRAERKL
jgi:hypothetical protein